MNWGRFKELVEEQGVKDSDGIEYIDFSSVFDEEPTVCFSDDGTFTVE